MNEPAEVTRSVIVERDFPYPPEKIWRALTQPELIQDWLMKNDFMAIIGHRFAFRAEWGAVDCRVLEIEPHRTLAYTWEAMGLESVVTWTLTPSASGTHLRLEQAGFRPDQARAFQGAGFGWQKFLGQLDGVLARDD